MIDTIRLIQIFIDILWMSSGYWVGKYSVHANLFCVLAMDQSVAKTAIAEYVWTNLSTIRLVFDPYRDFTVIKLDATTLVEIVVDSTCRAFTAVECILHLKGVEFSTLSREATHAREEAIKSYIEVVNAFLNAKYTADLMGDARNHYLSMLSIIQKDVARTTHSISSSETKN